MEYVKLICENNLPLISVDDKMQNMKFSETLTKLIPKDFGARSDLARKIGVTVNYITDIAAGRRKAPTLSRCRQIADALSLSKEEASQLIQSAAKERIRPEELEIIQSVKESLGKAYEWSIIRGESTCPHCHKDIEVEIDKKGNVTITGKVVARVKKY